MRNRHFRRVALATVVLTVGVAVTACAPAGTDTGGGSGDTTDDGVFNVLAVVSTSGSFGVFGNAVSHGAEAAAAVLNDNGGVLGQEVKVTTTDMAGDAAKGVTLLQQAIASGSRPDVAFLGLVATDALAMSPITTQSKILSFARTSAADVHEDVKTYPYSFSVNPAIASIGAIPADAMWNDGHHTAVTITPNTEGGLELVDAFTKHFEELGGEVLDAIRTEPGAADVVPDFNRAYSTQPDGIFVASQGQQVQMLHANYTAGGTIPLYGDISMSSDFRSQGVSEAELANATGEAVPVRLTTPDRRTEAQNTFFSAWAAVGPDENEASSNAAAGYDAVMAAAAAAEQAGSTDAAAMSSALENLDGDATWASGYRFTYTADDHQIALPEPGSDGVLPDVSFPLSTPYVHSDGGYFEYTGSITAD